MALVGLRNAPGEEGEMGYYVVAPFVTQGGKLVLANRGWIPLNMHRQYEDQLKEKVFCKVENVEIEGVFQEGENKVKNFFDGNIELF